jgi:hypothetical protein
MDTQLEVELVTKSDLLGLTMASWDQPRSTEQLLGFIARREAELAKVQDDDSKFD